jgi:ubiquitin-protein ligase
MAAPALRRIAQDLKALQAAKEAAPDEVRLTWRQDDSSPDYLMVVYVTMAGPVDTVYEPYELKLSVAFPKRFPFDSPTVAFDCCNVWHPNIRWEDGTVCVNLLNQAYLPGFRLHDILTKTIPLLLAHPNIHDPYNHDAAKEMQDAQQADQPVKAWKAVIARRMKAVALHKWPPVGAGSGASKQETPTVAAGTGEEDEEEESVGQKRGKGSPEEAASSPRKRQAIDLCSSGSGSSSDPVSSSSSSCSDDDNASASQPQESQ